MAPLQPYPTLPRAGILDVNVIGYGAWGGDAGGMGGGSNGEGDAGGGGGAGGSGGGKTFRTYSETAMRTKMWYGEHRPPSE